MKKPNQFPKIKNMTTKHLRAFFNNDYIGIDGLDSEPFKHEIDQELWRREAIEFDKKQRELEKQLNEYQEYLEQGEILLWFIQSSILNEDT